VSIAEVQLECGALICHRTTSQPHHINPKSSYKPL